MAMNEATAMAVSSQPELGASSDRLAEVVERAPSLSPDYIAAFGGLLAEVLDKICAGHLHVSGETMSVLLRALEHRIILTNRRLTTDPAWLEEHATVQCHLRRLLRGGTPASTTASREPLEACEGSAGNGPVK